MSERWESVRCGRKQGGQDTAPQAAFLNAAEQVASGKSAGQTAQGKSAGRTASGKTAPENPVEQTAPGKPTWQTASGKPAGQTGRDTRDGTLHRAVAAALVLAVTVSVTSLALGAAGKLGTGSSDGAAGTFPSRGFSDASAAAVDAIRENEALAVFLGWETPDDAVPASVRTEDGIYLPDPPSPPGFWDYFAEAIGRLFAP